MGNSFAASSSKFHFIKMIKKLVVVLRHGARVPLAPGKETDTEYERHATFRYLEAGIPPFTTNKSDRTLLTDEGFQQAIQSGRLVGQ